MNACIAQDVTLSSETYILPEVEPAINLLLKYAAHVILSFAIILSCQDMPLSELIKHFPLLLNSIKVLLPKDTKPLFCGVSWVEWFLQI